MECVRGRRAGVGPRLGLTQWLYMFSHPYCSGSLPAGQGRREPSRLLEPGVLRKWFKEHRLLGQSSRREAVERWRALGQALHVGDGEPRRVPAGWPHE